MTAIDVSSVLGLVAIGLLTANLLMGLLLSVGYNPVRQWPARRVKLFTLHNWTGYLALAVAVTHPVTLLFSSTAGFVPRDIVLPIWSPTQPLENTLGAIALYLVIIVVGTSYFRTLFGHRNWKRLHFTAYASAAVFYTHGLLSDPLLKNRPVDWIDAEKVYVEGCLLAVAIATLVRIQYGRGRAHRGERALARRFGLSNS